MISKSTNKYINRKTTSSSQTAILQNTHVLHGYCIILATKTKIKAKTPSRDP